MPYFGQAVNPSMNPSRVQRRRSAILGSLVTPIPKLSLIFCIVCTRAAYISSASNGLFSAASSTRCKVRLCNLGEMSDSTHLYELAMPATALIQTTPV